MLLATETGTSSDLLALFARSFFFFIVEVSIRLPLDKLFCNTLEILCYQNYTITDEKVLLLRVIAS